MSRTKYFDVTVLAANAAELSSIAHQMSEPSPEIKRWVHERYQWDGYIFDFSPIPDVLNRTDRNDAACQFRAHMRGAFGLINNHVVRTSEAFPSAVFLMESYDMDSFTEKEVFHGGRLLRETYDHSRHLQGGIWALLDIFTPFLVEYELGVPVGSLWDEWLADVIEAAHNLRLPAAYAPEPPEPLDLTFADEMPGIVKEPLPGEPRDLVQKQLRDGAWSTLCNICHQPVPASSESWQLDGDEDFGYDTGRTVCFEVTPCNVTLEMTDALGTAENWRKFKPGTFVICSACAHKLGVVPTQLPLTSMSKAANLRDGVVRPSSVVEPPVDESARPEADGVVDLQGLEDLV